MEPHLYHSTRAPVEGLLAAAALRRATRGPLGPRYGVQRVPEVTTKAPKTNFLVATRDLRSPLQLLADTLAITVLSIVTGIVFHLVFHSVYGPVVLLAETGLLLSVLFAGIDRLTTAPETGTLTTSFDRVRNAAQSWTLAFGGLVFIFFAAKAGGVLSRGAVLSLFFVGLPAVAAWRVLTPVALAHYNGRSGFTARNCIIIGDLADSSLDNFAAELTAASSAKPTILKFQATCPPAEWPSELKQLISRAMDAAHKSGPGEVFLCAGGIATERLGMIGRALRVLPRAIFVLPNAETAPLFQCKTASFGRHVAVELRHEPMGPLQRALKRAMDISISGTAIAVLLPFLLAVALAIKVDSAGPVLFRQTRNGYRGRPFKILKFRSMHVLEDGPAIQQAQRGDARVTRIGCFLRKSSIDELPQLFNVLMGDMSLVGPRPHAQAHDELYSRCIENYDVRQHVKPGITGWAQVNGLRGETATLDAMYRRIEFDLWYAVNASVLLDIEILVRTAIEVCRQRNAY